MLARPRPSAPSPCRAVARRHPPTIAAAAASPGGRGAARPPVLTAPTVLTLARVAAVPLLAVGEGLGGGEGGRLCVEQGQALWITAAAPPPLPRPPPPTRTHTTRHPAWFRAPPKPAPLITASIFAAASVTDALDGWLARATGATSAFGAFLDPVADKLATSTALVLLASRPAAAGWGAAAPWLLPACAAAVVGREVAMSALREWAAAAGPAARAAAAVSAAGKAKTALQMVAIVALLLASGRPCCAPKAGVGAAVYHAAVAVGAPALVGGAVLGLVSLGQYFVALWPWLSGARAD